MKCRTGLNNTNNIGWRSWIASMNIYRNYKLKIKNMATKSDPDSFSHTMEKQVSDSNREIVITRLINAHRALVFEAWITPEYVAKWWGPNGFTNTIHEMDVRPGGVWRFTMHGPAGVDYPNRI